MSITTADAMWYAYYAWGNGAASVLFKAGSIFFDLIYHFAPPVVSLSIVDMEILQKSSVIGSALQIENCR
ncbi:hypothetical protein [Achromobacter veterisilvae]|uniref:hypothetical protein n=1 Tax=Achromobacter veterisilvae TaxID=2069367 RepID=UPI00100E0689|nr:hypothetical protein [Achromobacter veterisilvae]